MSIKYLSEEGELKPWPESGTPDDVNTDPARAVEAVAVAVEKSESEQDGLSSEAKTR